LPSGHEPRFCLESSHHLAWIQSRDSLPTRVSRTIRSKVCLISMIWSTTRIHCLSTLPTGYGTM
jgi:hypothetical protein